MGNIEFRVGSEPMSLAFCTSVLTITPPRFPDVTTLSTHTYLCDSLPERSVQTTSLVIYTEHQAR